MNKRKIMLAAMALCMVAILAIGGSLAYLTDSDQQINTFTTGNVAIDLFEDFGDNDPDTIEKLMPTTGKDAEGKQKNGIEKEVYVKNTGSEKAYVRVHIAIPDDLDSGALDNPALNASDNIVHFNMSAASIADGKWNWGISKDAPNYPGNGGAWNTYETKIGTIDYNVYVVTYETELAGATKDADGNDVYAVTEDAIWQVYMDMDTTNDQITTLKGILGDNWNIYVAAEACQWDGFEGEPFVALNTTFGDPQAEGYATKVNWNKIAEGDVWVDWTSSKGF